VSLFTRWMSRRCGGVAAFYEALNAPLEQAGLRAVRARLAADLTGRVLEIGCGTGLNFPHYPPGAEVTAIEPLEEFRTFAAQRASAAAARIRVQDGDAQALPFADHSFDAALATLVFCSIAAAEHGLQEVRRVLRSGAPVRFFEHVRSERPFGALLQDISNPVWRRMMDGCNLNRDTVAAIRAAGFTIERVQAHELRVPRAPHFPMREVHARA
jgi:SAM-dependent methyltransferase